jgi:hypothetical protein
VCISLSADVDVQHRYLYLCLRSVTYRGTRCGHNIHSSRVWDGSQSATLRAPAEPVLVCAARSRVRGPGRCPRSQPAGFPANPIYPAMRTSADMGCAAASRLPSPAPPHQHLTTIRTPLCLSASSASTSGTRSASVPFSLATTTVRSVSTCQLLLLLSPNGNVTLP